MAIAITIIALALLYIILKWMARLTSATGLPRTTPKRRLRPALKQTKPDPAPPPPPPRPRPGKEECPIARHPFLPNYQIAYTDRNGMTTEREITISKIEGDAMCAYCHLRHAKRHFYISRVSQWTNCSTGEIVIDILEDFKAEREKSVYGLLDRMSDDLYPALGTLIYLGKGGGRLIIDERNIIIETFKTLCPDPRLTDQMINDSINDTKVPSRADYKLLITALADMDPEIQSITLNAANSLFADRKSLNSIEKEGIEELNKTLNMPGNHAP